MIAQHLRKADTGLAGVEIEIPYTMYKRFSEWALWKKLPTVSSAIESYLLDHAKEIEQINTPKHLVQAKGRG